MSRDWLLYLDDMIACCRKVIEYTREMDMDAFLGNAQTYDAVLRNLEILGEAAKNIPEDVRRRRPDVEWRKIAGLRTSISALRMKPYGTSCGIKFTRYFRCWNTSVRKYLDRFSPRYSI
jgi:hypothetical protein